MNTLNGLGGTHLQRFIMSRIYNAIKAELIKLFANEQMLDDGRCDIKLVLQLTCFIIK